MFYKNLNVLESMLVVCNSKHLFKNNQSKKKKDVKFFEEIE